jgi:hypothetical protein
MAQSSFFHRLRCVVSGAVWLTAVTLPLLFTSCTTLATPPIAALPTQWATAVSPTPTPQPTNTLTHQPTNQPTYTPTNTPTITPTTTPTIKPTNTPTPLPPGQHINGLPKTEFIILPTAVQENIRAIYAAGQALGRRPHAFSKLGDSGAATPDFLMRFDQRAFDLGDYTYLQPTLEYYKGSWVHYGAALHVGLHATSVFRLERVTEALCLPEEHMLACEFRLYNPSLLLIALGANDQSNEFTAKMERILTYASENGVIPILITKADRAEGADNRNNIAMRQLATAYRVPLLDFDRLADTLPNRGLRSDGVHLTSPTSRSYTTPEDFTSGYAVYNLATIMMIDEIWQTLNRETAVIPFDPALMP